eukprot:7205360-Prorocentrum_lima.AAC.1
MSRQCKEGCAKNSYWRSSASEWTFSVDSKWICSDCKVHGMRTATASKTMAVDGKPAQRVCATNRPRFAALLSC